MNSCFPQLTALNIKDEKIDEKCCSNNRKKNFYCASIANSKSQSLSKHSKGKMSGVGANVNTSASLAGVNGDLKSAVGKIEVLQDLDLYYIKQIAHNLKEYDLEQKIEVEIKMREGTTRLLAACKHQTQVLDAAKNLLISNERMNAYMTELQTRNREQAKIISSSSNTQQACTGRVSLSELRIPLIWRDTDHFKNKGEYRRYAVFCLVRVGTEIYDTSLLCPVDRSLTDLTFPDSLVFNKIRPDFKMKLEVYSHMLQDDLSIASAPRRIKNTIHTSISRTVGKKLAATLRDELNSEKIGPSFEMVATAELTLDEANDNIRTHDLKIENSGNGRHQLPLFGHFCCRLAAQPIRMIQETYSGVVYIPDSFVKGCNATTKDRRNWVKCWAQLSAFKLKFWLSCESQAEEREPDYCVDVNRDTVVNLKKNSPIDIEIWTERGENSVIVRCESNDERTKWFKNLTQEVFDSDRWKQAADTLMTIQMNEPYRSSYITMRHGSLYDQTPIFDTFATKDNNSKNNTLRIDMPITRSAHRASISTTDSLSFRQRSSSSAKPRSSRLSAWPFSSKK